MNEHKLDADRIKRRALLFREQYPGSTLAGFADDILNVLSVLDVSEDRAGELQALLESLTPGGSEFHDSPENCARWIRERMASVMKEVQRRKAAEALTAALLESAGTIVVMSDRNYLCANLEGEWCVYTTHNPPKMLYQGPDLERAVRVLKEGKE